MKFIIIPLIRAIFIALIYTIIIFPIAIASCIISLIWNFDLSFYREIFTDEEDSFWRPQLQSALTKNFCYKTCLDYILNKKTYDEN